MCISEMFEKVGAPLLNSRWSWGGTRQDGTIVLRVWQNEARWVNGRAYIQITHNEAFVGKESDLGYQERLFHLEKIMNGAHCFMVMCEPKNPTEVPRQIKAFNERELFRAGSLVRIENDYWAPIIERIHIS